jgi:hypothetical protein
MVMKCECPECGKDARIIEIIILCKECQAISEYFDAGPNGVTEIKAIDLKD